MNRCHDDSLEKCSICLQQGTSKNPLVDKPDIPSLLSRCQVLVGRGENELLPLLERLRCAAEGTSYHSRCRKNIMHPKRKLSFEDPDMPPKRPGRPSKVVKNVRPQRSPFTPKEKRCMFANTEFCSSIEVGTELHKVESDSMGDNLLYIRHNTKADDIRICVSDLEETGDASALEKHYHLACLQNAKQSCKSDSDNIAMTRNICDQLLLLSVKTSLSVMNTTLNMNEINAEYLSILEEYGICHLVSQNQKKYIKELLMLQIPEIQFVSSTRKNESQLVSLASHVSQAMEFKSSHSSPIEAMASVADMLRQEAMAYRSWKFENGFDNFKCPPMLQFFLSQFLFGRFSEAVTGKRDAERQNTISISCQFLLQNIRTDRQVRHLSKANEGFRSKIETPLNIGLPLVVHTNSREKSLVDQLHDIGIGRNYQQILDLEKRAEYAVLKRMQKYGNFCLPDFVRKGVSTWFAVDNIDLLEDTPYGQNTFHGTVIVLNQRAGSNNELMNEPLTIPSKLPEQPLHAAVKYCDEPVIQQKPIRFQDFRTNQRQHLLHRYNNFSETWLLASSLANKSDASRDNSCLVEDKDDTGLAINTSSESTVSEQGIVEICPKIKNIKTKDKADVMPTWAATNSLLSHNQESCNTRLVNTESVAPLLKTPPTDYATLYTALSLTQNISASILGSQRCTLITLDLDLYNRAVHIQESINNRNWILLPGGLHICFAVEHALGKTLEGSGIDTCAIECGTYSAAALRGIHSGKAFKRALEYHLINALAIMMLKCELLPDDSTLKLNLKDKCCNLKEALNERDPSMSSLFNEVKETYISSIQQKLNVSTNGSLSQYFDQYLDQLENLLQIISACRRGDWEGYLAALESAIKFFFAHDLFNYSRLMPHHIAQMNEVQINNPEVWGCLVSGDFVVNKSGIPFTSLFTDQALEQEIKNLKRFGGMVGITQNKDALDRMMHATPYLSKVVKGYLDNFNTRISSNRKEHYQLQGNFAVRIHQNALKLKKKLLSRRDGNPYILEYLSKVWSLLQ